MVHIRNGVITRVPGPLVGLRVVAPEVVEEVGVHQSFAGASEEPEHAVVAGPGGMREALSREVLTIEDAARSIERVPEVRAARHPGPFACLRVEAPEDIIRVEIHAASVEPEIVVGIGPGVGAFADLTGQVEGRGHATRSQYPRAGHGVAGHPSPFVGWDVVLPDIRHIPEWEGAGPLLGRPAEHPEVAAGVGPGRTTKSARAGRIGGSGDALAAKGGRLVDQSAVAFHPGPHPRVWIEPPQFGKVMRGDVLPAVQPERAVLTGPEDRSIHPGGEIAAVGYTADAVAGGHIVSRITVHPGPEAGLPGGISRSGANKTQQRKASKQETGRGHGGGGWSFQCSENRMLDEIGYLANSQ